jgi:hypothetical protein
VGPRRNAIERGRAAAGGRGAARAVALRACAPRRPTRSRPARRGAASRAAPPAAARGRRRRPAGRRGCRRLRLRRGARQPPRAPAPACASSHAAHPATTPRPGTAGASAAPSSAMLVYGAVARGAAVLSEYSLVAGNFGAVARDCLGRAPPSGGRATHAVDGHVFFLLGDGAYSERARAAGGPAGAGRAAGREGGRWRAVRGAAAAAQRGGGGPGLPGAPSVCRLAADVSTPPLPHQTMSSPPARPRAARCPTPCWTSSRRTLWPSEGGRAAAGGAAAGGGGRREGRQQEGWVGGTLRGRSTRSAGACTSPKTRRRPVGAPRSRPLRSVPTLAPPRPPHSDPAHAPPKNQGTARRA